MTSFLREKKNTVSCQLSPAIADEVPEKIETGGGHFAILDFSGPDRVCHRLEMVESLTRRLLGSPVTSTPGLARLSYHFLTFYSFYMPFFRQRGMQFRKIKITTKIHFNFSMN